MISELPGRTLAGNRRVRGHQMTRQRRSLKSRFLIASAVCLVMILQPLAAIPAQGVSSPLTLANAADATVPATGGWVTLSYVTPDPAVSWLTSCTLQSSADLIVADSVTTSPTALCNRQSWTKKFWLGANPSSSSRTVTFTYSGSRRGVPKQYTVAVQQPGAASRYYVALGDSYSAGEGVRAKGWVDTSGAATGSTSVGDGCNRSSGSYTARFAQWLALQPQYEGIQYASYACSGATTEDLFKDSQSPGNASGNKGEPRQLIHDSILAKAAVVTLTIGGNDVDFVSVLAECVVNLDVAGCRHDVSYTKQVGRMKSLLEGQTTWLSNTYAEVRRKAPNARIYVLDYPDIFPASGKVTSRCGFFSQKEIVDLQMLQTKLHAFIRTATSAAGVNYIDPNSLFQNHSTCASKKDRWFFPISATRGVGSFVHMTASAAHPNAAGHAAMAKALGVPDDVAVPNCVRPKDPSFTYRDCKALWRKAGFKVYPAIDAMNRCRLKLVDSNWIVTSQNIPFGVKNLPGSWLRAWVIKTTDFGPVILKAPEKGACDW